MTPAVQQGTITLQCISGRYLWSHPCCIEGNCQMRYKIDLPRDEVIERLKISFIGDFDAFHLPIGGLPRGIYGSVEQVEDDVAFSLYVSIIRTWGARVPLAHLGGSLTADGDCTILSAHWRYSVWAYMLLSVFGIFAIARLLSDGSIFLLAAIGIYVFITEISNAGQKEALEQALEDLFPGHITGRLS